MKKETSWGGESVVGYYQKNVIAPNLRRLLAPAKGEVILDLGCGEGYFSKQFADAGAQVIGIDNSKTLVLAARKDAGKNEEYYKASAEKLDMLRNSSVDKIVVILAIQSMDNLHQVLKECHRVLKPATPATPERSDGGQAGKIFIVMNHPAFRVPKASDWAWDDIAKKQYRRVDSYLTEEKSKIEMHPSTGQGQVPRSSEYTISFHRPLQVYFKLLKNSGFAVTNLEEWISPKDSEPGPRAAAENTARKEIPLFLFLEAAKI